MKYRSAPILIASLIWGLNASAAPCIGDQAGYSIRSNYGSEPRNFETIKEYFGREPGSQYFVVSERYIVDGTPGPVRNDLYTDPSQVNDLYLGKVTTLDKCKKFAVKNDIIFSNIKIEWVELEAGVFKACHYWYQTQTERFDSYYGNVPFSLIRSVHERVSGESYKKTLTKQLAGCK